jgi:hypothetical protein
VSSVRFTPCPPRNYFSNFERLVDLEPRRVIPDFLENHPIASVDSMIAVSIQAMLAGWFLISLFR